MCFFFFTQYLKKFCTPTHSTHPHLRIMLSRNAKFRKSSICTKISFTQSPPKFLEVYTKVNAKTLQPEEGLLMEKHVMLKDLSSAEVSVGSHKTKH